MRSNDIRVGERYVARHRGKAIIVTIDEVTRIPATSEFGRTMVRATNHASGESITFRTALSIMRPAGPTIGEVKTIEDLFVDQIAVPEQGVQYRLRRANEDSTFTKVDYVIRRGDSLVAVTENGEPYSITGEGACILVPSRS